MLAFPVIRKLQRECFQEDTLALSGVICVLLADQKPWLEHLQLRLQNLPRTVPVVREIVGGPPAPQVELSLQVTGISDKRHPNDSFILGFLPIEGYSRLCIYGSYSRRGKRPVSPVLISSIEQIETFIAAVQAEQERNHLHAKKEEKLDKFRRQGFVGQLKELGHVHQFGFAIGETVRDFQLSLRVGILKWAYHFSFPKSMFEKILPALPELTGHLWRHIQPRSLTDELFAFHFNNPQGRPPIFVEQFPALIACLDHIQSLGVTLLPPDKSISTWVNPASDDPKENERLP